MILANLKCLSRLAVTLGLTLATLQPLAAQNSPGSVDAGRSLAI